MYRLILPTLLLAFQASQSEEPPVSREIRNGEVHSYRIHIESDVTDVSETIDYTLRTRCKQKAKDDKELVFELRFRDYNVSIPGKRSHRSGVVGAAQIDIPAVGLPDRIKTTFSQELYWYPFLTWFLPRTAKAGAFDADEDLGSGARLKGKGTVKGDTFDLKGKLADSSGGGPDVNLSWKVGADGWLADGEGTVVTPAGTVTFKVRAA